MKRILFCALALVFMTSSAFAEEELAPGYNACMENSGGVTAKMNDCMENAYNYLDKRLNAKYKKARQACMDSSNPGACSEKLLKMQRHWIQYKELMSELVGLPNEGGSMAGLAGMSFLVDETAKQARLLGNIAGDE